MTKYVVIYENVEKDGIVKGLLPHVVKSHVEYLKDLHSQGILLMWGPFKGCRNGLLIFEANSLEEVESYILKDPFISDTGYASYLIYEWMEANKSNDYLLNECQKWT